MSEILILYVLVKYDCTIYRIMKILDDIFFAFLKTSAGTINPALKKLEKLECVEFIETMSDGGMKSKKYSITSVGKKHLVDLLLNWECRNPYHILNEAKLIYCCADVLSINELIKFKQNARNYLELHKIKIEKGLDDENLSQSQKITAQITLLEINEILKIYS